MVLIRTITILLLSMSSLWAKDTHLYDSAFVGENNLSHYYGTFYPHMNHNFYTGEVLWRDQGLEDKYINSLQLGEGSGYQNFFYDELKSAITCPNELLSKNVNYIRYTYRILAMSYLYEAINHYQDTLIVLGKSKKCSFNWKKVFKSCKPQSDDMKKYIKNLIKLDDFFKTKLDKRRMYDVRKKAWLKDFKSGARSDISQVRLDSWCFENNEDCSKLYDVDIIDQLQNKCLEDKEILNSICNESDRLYGLSYVPHAQDLLSSSNIINVFNETGQGSGCLMRYSEMFSRKEKYYDFLIDLFPVVLNSLVSKFKGRYNEGKLFVPGSFKEFEQKGLADVYESTQRKKKKKRKKKEVVEYEPIEKIVRIKDQKIVVKTKVKKTKIAKLTPVKEKREIVKKSAFLKAAEKVALLGLQSSEVDMKMFKYDYVFSFSALQKLHKPLKRYMSQKALKEMKSHDGLGSKQGPIPLIFLKYMIDTNQHQGLYNIVSILGDRFFVSNDIDRSNPFPSNLVQLKNDFTTNMKWQIKVLDETLAPKK